MSELFNRDFALKVGAWALETRKKGVPVLEDGLCETTLDVEFDITKTSAKEPNAATITIYNLNEVNRAILAKCGDKKSPTVLPLSVEAGYVGSRDLIFLGDIDMAPSSRSGVDWVTKIEASDGGNSYRSKRFQKSYGRNTSIVQILKDLVTAYGIGPGNLFDAIIANPRGLRVYYNGIVVSGRISEQLDRFLCSAGFTWSIQNRQLQVLHPGKPNHETAVLLNQGSGLIGTPEIGEKGVVSATALLQGSIRPGRRVVIKTSTADGIFVVDQANYKGATGGNDWYVNFSGKPEVTKAA